MREVRNQPEAVEWRGEESPKGFFDFLRSHPARFHRVFSKWLGEAGFEPRWLCKRANHNIWNIHLLRGSVAPGEEIDTAVDIICAALRHCGVDCRKNDIEVSAIGNRLGASFIFEQGTPGSLVFTKGREAWCADEWP
jgi:hypothetical protein